MKQNKQVPEKSIATCGKQEVWNQRSANSDDAERR